MKDNHAALRGIEDEDLELILQWRNSERIRSCMFTDRIITIEEHRRWYSSLKENNAVEYLVFEYGNTPIGLTYFTEIDHTNLKCCWGFYIGSEQSPPGSGSRMARLSIDYAFGKMNIRKLYGMVFAFNTPSVNLFKKMGFRQEACYREHLLKNGKFEDVIVFALLNREWANSSIR